MAELEWNFGTGFEIVAKRFVLQGFNSRFRACVTKERESERYRVDETVQGELVKSFVNWIEFSNCLLYY